MNIASKNTEISDDIDLLVLIERSLAFVKRYKWTFILAVLLGLSAGYLFYRSQPRVYKSKMILHSFLLTNQELIAIGENWNELLRKHEYPTLAKLFNCSESMLRQVKQIKPQEIQKIFTPTNPNGFYVNVTVTDNAILDSLEKAIVYGYQNTPYIRQKVDLKVSNLQQLIATTTREIEKLDSTRQVFENIIRGKNQISASLMVDGSGFNKQIIETNQKLMGFKEDLKFSEAIQVFQGFNSFSKPAGPKLYVWLTLGLILFLSLAYLYALLDSINTGLRNRRRGTNAVPDR
jgi:hypothetical protein